MTSNCPIITAGESATAPGHAPGRAPKALAIPASRVPSPCGPGLPAGRQANSAAPPALVCNENADKKPAPDGVLDPSRTKAPEPLAGMNLL